MKNLVFCTIIDEPLVKVKETQRKVYFASDVKLKVPMEAGMMCTINGKVFFVHKEHVD